MQIKLTDQWNVMPEKCTNEQLAHENTEQYGLTVIDFKNDEGHADFFAVTYEGDEEQLEAFFKNELSYDEDEWTFIKTFGSETLYAKK